MKFCILWLMVCLTGAFASEMELKDLTPDTRTDEIKPKESAQNPLPKKSRQFWKLPEDGKPLYNIKFETRHHDPYRDGIRKKQ